MKRFLLFITSTLALVAFWGNIIAAPVMAVSADQSLCEGSGGVWKSNACTKAGDNRTVGGLFKNIANILIFIVGAIAVIMIIIGGIRYTTAQGDSSAVAAAKNTIIYAIVGVVVALMSYAVVNFVLKNI